MNGKDAVLLFIPGKLWGHWEAFRPIIYHEMSHFINLEDPDEVFYERADAKSIQLWDMLANSEMLACNVEKE